LIFNVKNAPTRRASARSKRENLGIGTEHKTQPRFRGGSKFEARESTAVVVLQRGGVGRGANGGEEGRFILKPRKGIKGDSFAKWRNPKKTAKKGVEVSTGSEKSGLKERTVLTYESPILIWLFAARSNKGNEIGEGEWSESRKV